MTTAVAVTLGMTTDGNGNDDELMAETLPPYCHWTPVSYQPDHNVQLLQLPVHLLLTSPIYQPVIPSTRSPTMPVQYKYQVAPRENNGKRPAATKIGRAHV